ncbi:unnamed protein product, partial [Mesorhabditis spiculigera]
MEMTKKVSFDCPSSSSSSSTELSNCEANEDLHPYRAIPLSTKNVIFLTVGMAFFSFIYLFPAQHDKFLFYGMTGLIVLFITTIYTVGSLSVVYMVTDPYSKELKDVQFESYQGRFHSLPVISEASEEVAV